jgi:PAS domain-containing protein
VEKLNARAPDDARGARSKYLRGLIERDLDNQPVDVNALAPDVLEFLTRELCGKPDALRMRAVVNGLDQVQELKRLLLGYIAEAEMEWRQRVADGSPQAITDEKVAAKNAKLLETMGGQKSEKKEGGAEESGNRRRARPSQSKHIR